MGVGRRAEAFRKPRIKLVFVGPRKPPVRNFKAQPFESWGRDKDEQRAIRHLTLQKIRQALANEFFAR